MPIPKIGGPFSLACELNRPSFIKSLFMLFFQLKTQGKNFFSKIPFSLLTIAPFYGIIKVRLRDTDIFETRFSDHD